MEEALSRQEYPAMLGRLTPAGAVSKLNERVKKIGKVNAEIADWLQERRKVEDAYVMGLKKLSRRPLQETGGELGIFDSPWKKIISSTETIAISHATLSQRIEKDIEYSLRNFATSSRDMSNVGSLQGNLAIMAKEQEDAHDKAEKLSRKGGKANAQKVESANSRFQSAQQQWDSQAPFIFESLQALDESRLNHLRDILTQYLTLDTDQIARSQKAIEETMGSLLDLDTSQEIQTWSQANVSEKPRQRTTRQQSTASSNITASNLAPPQTPGSTAGDTASERFSEQSGRLEPPTESKLKRGFGTILKVRRQSIHGGFARAPSPSKSFPSFSRATASRDGRPNPSPRASSNNLREGSHDNRLSSLAESPVSPRSPYRDPNGIAPIPSIPESQATESNAPNGVIGGASPDLSGVEPPPGPPPSHLKAENRKDSDGFNVPSTTDDPISRAQQEAANEADQPQFNLAIRNEPIPEQDSDAQAALSNVANTLRSAQAVTPSRKVGTVRGRRDGRNSIYLTSPNSQDMFASESPLPPSPNLPIGRPAAVSALSGEHAASASDTTSIHSGHSLMSNALVKHAEMHGPGLNASFIETVSATLENGEVTTSKISGEIALIYNKVETGALASSELIRINNFSSLDTLGPNRTFIHQISDAKPDEFTIDFSTLSPKPHVAFTYQVQPDGANQASKAPLLLKSAWRVDKDKLNLILEYSLNPAYGTESVQFHSLDIYAIYTGAGAAGCQTKPSGTHSKKNSLVFWRLGEVELTNKWEKLICRLVGTEGAIPGPGHIEARWEISSNLSLGSGISLSTLEPGKGKEKEESDNPFVDEVVSPTTTTPVGNWVDVESSRKLIGGKYEAISQV